MALNEPPPQYVFITDDLAIYERVDPDEFVSYDDVDSRDITERGHRDLDTDPDDA